MPERLKARLLTAVWGERYVREFAQVSLPSYLSAGNIPELADNVDLEVVILTTGSSVHAFRNEPAFLRLQSLCHSRFLLIDDLITTGNYGVILTLAYARGIIDAGADQLNTWFIFMNSDFVLADGGMKNLIPILGTDHPCHYVSIPAGKGGDRSAPSQRIPHGRRDRAHHFLKGRRRPCLGQFTRNGDWQNDHTGSCYMSNSQPDLLGG